MGIKTFFMHEGPEFLIPIFIFLGGFALLFALRYFSNRENMALIEKGINPRKGMPRHFIFRGLKLALLLIGAGAGLLLAYIISAYLVPHREENPAIYFGLIGLGGGLGLYQSFKIERADLMKMEDDGKEG